MPQGSGIQEERFPPCLSVIGCIKGIATSSPAWGVQQRLESITQKGPVNVLLIADLLEASQATPRHGFVGATCSGGIGQQGVSTAKRRVEAKWKPSCAS